MASGRVSSELRDKVRKFGPTDTINGYNPVLWHLDKTGRDLRPPQVMYHYALEENNYCVIVAAQRTGKSVGKVDKNLMDAACNDYEDLRYFAPARRQAVNNLKENVRLIEDSPLLKRCIKRINGRPQLGNDGYTFEWGSNAAAFGEKSEIDSENATIMDVDEFDDFNMEVFNDRVLPRGVGANRNGLPTRLRISGTIQFQDGPLREMENNEAFYVVPKITLYHARTMGLMDEQMFNLLKDQYTDEQWLRIALCMYADSRNFFASEKVRRCLLAAQRYGVGVEHPRVGGFTDRNLYLKVGLALDMGAQGTTDTSSKYALTVWGLTGTLHKVLLYAREFEPGIDPKQLEIEVVRIWAFFNPDKGYGDAFDANIVASINDALYDASLISFDRRRDCAEHTPSNWAKWVFSPCRFEGREKDRIFKLLQMDIRNEVAVIPMPDDDFRFRDPSNSGRIVTEGEDSVAKLVTQLGNIRAERNKAGYNSYSMIKPKLGDDLVDSAAMGVFAIETGLHAATSGSGRFASSGNKLAAIGARW